MEDYRFFMVSSWRFFEGVSCAAGGWSLNVLRFSTDTGTPDRHEIFMARAQPGYSHGEKNTFAADSICQRVVNYVIIRSSRKILKAFVSSITHKYSSCAVVYAENPLEEEKVSIGLPNDYNFFLFDDNRVEKRITGITYIYIWLTSYYNLFFAFLYLKISCKNISSFSFSFEARKL